jgi:protein-S-isoprenylcysteine O-methyltransferase Ste14
VSLAGRSAGADATEWTGRLLVLLQFGLLAVMGWRAAVAASAAASPAALLLACSGLLALWALAANRPGNFNIRPTPRHGGTLITSGPYRWVRHPMYSAVLLAAAAAALKSFEPADALLWLALLGVLLAKATIEERALMRRFPDYQDYRVQTTRFVPWLV